MRTLNECRAEVFRRSEKRIKERRQRRNRFMMLCVPLALCLALFLSLALPELIPARTNTPGTNELATGLQIEGQPESAVLSVVKVEVTGHNRSVTHTAAEDVQKICQYLEQCKLTPPQAGGAGKEDPSGIKTETPDPMRVTGSDCCTITLTTAAGAKLHYRLAGTVLQELTGNESYTLTQKQAQELKGLLGLE